MIYDETIHTDGTVPSSEVPTGLVCAAEQTRVCQEQSAGENEVQLPCLPLPWLVRLLDFIPCASPQANPSSRLVPLFRTCTAFRDLIVRFRRPQLHLQLRQDNLAGLAATLRLGGCRGCGGSKKGFGVGVNVHVAFSRPFPGPESCEQLLKQVVRLAAAEMPSGTLEAITSLELTDVTLAGFVPDWLQQACPNLTSISLERCNLQPSPSTPTAPAIHTRLQRMTIGASTLPVNDTHLQLWHDSLAALPTLDTLSVSAPLAGHRLSLFSPLGPSLRHLQLKFHSCTQPIVSLFPHLVTLDLSTDTITDDKFAHLQALPNLLSFTCRALYVTQDYSTHPNQLQPIPTNNQQRDPLPWRHLAVRLFLHVPTLGRLPLNNLQVLEYRHGQDQTRNQIQKDVTLTITVTDVAPMGEVMPDGFHNPDMQCIQRAIHVINHCGGVFVRQDAIAIKNWGWIARGEGVLGLSDIPGVCGAVEEVKEERLIMYLSGQEGMHEAFARALLLAALACRPTVLQVNEHMHNAMEHLCADVMQMPCAKGVVMVVVQ